MGCQTHHFLVLHKQDLNFGSLASSHINSPEPRCPPNGEIIVAECVLGTGYLKECPELHLEVIFKDYSKEEIVFPIVKSFGTFTYRLEGPAFCEKGGILTYRAELKTKEGKLIEDWNHQLWFKLIAIDRTSSES